MSRFGDTIQALRAPLEFVGEHPDQLDRAVNAREAVQTALARAQRLELPPDARRRLADLATLLESGDFDAKLANAGLARLGPLLDPAYPARALGLSTERVPGVGPKIARTLSEREVGTIQDLLFLLPRSYEDRRELLSIEELKVGQRACFEGTIVRTGVVSLRNGRSFLEAVVSDGTGAVSLKWFRGLQHFRDRLEPDLHLLVAGDVRRYRYGKELHHPEIEVLARDTAQGSLARIVPVYSTIEGVPGRTLRRIVAGAVSLASDLVDAHLPEATAAEIGLPDVGESLRQVHSPGVHLDPVELRERRTPYHLRLVAEELFLLQAGLAMRRGARARQPGKALPAQGPEVRRAIESLPFELTGDQKQVWREIAADLCRPRPMSRLLVGDVGTGKTVLAVLGAVAAHAGGGLTAVAAPTEILAEQHLRTFRALAGPLGLRVALLTGSTPAAERRVIERALAASEIEIIVGTHALLGDSVSLPGLRLVVIDEQHRFGVKQRQALGRKGDKPHVLAMSATPIPRSLSLTLFGDQDHSLLRERPPGRAPVQTRVVPPDAARAVLGELRETLARGEQAYVVYPLVEESEKQDLLDATRGFERLKRALPDVRVALLHGRIDARARAAAMDAFASGEVQLLVCTTVIEVGVDVANATLLIVQHAERFGLAQLHQLRGRVGRGGTPGRAILFGDPQGEAASRRLAVLESSESGFDIAEQDLAIRGAGEWLGTRQAGHLPELRLADLVRHADLLPPVREAADRLVAGDPTLQRHPALRAAITQRWGRRLDLGSVA